MKNNLQEQISRIKSMMFVINEEEESIISKLKKIKEFKNEGFKTAYVEDPYGKPDKTGELYYVFTQTNKGCEDLLSKTFISFSERNKAHWSGVKDISKADAILILTHKIVKNNVVFKLKLSWACELVYGDAAVEKIKNLIDDYNEKEKGVTVDDFLELRSFMLNKEEIKKLNNQSEEDAKLSYTPPKPSSIDEKDFVFSATSDGNISVSVLKTYPSDKDPSRLFYFNGPMVTYNPVIYGPLGIEIELNITEYNNETNTLTMDLSKCDYAACKDKNGNPKVITTTLNKIKPKILKSVTDGYKVNNFKLIELEVNAKDENNKDTSKDVGLIPLNTTIASNWSNFGGDNTSLMAKDEKEKLKEQISRIKSMMSN